MSWIYSPVVLVVTIAFMTVVTFSHVKRTYEHTENLTWDYVERMALLNPILPAEYLTRWQPETTVWTEAMAEIMKNDLVKTVSGNGYVTATIGRDSAIRVLAEIVSPVATIRLRQLYLPQWQGSPSPPRPSVDGVIVLQLSRGHHDFVLRLSPFSGELLGRRISAGAFLITVIGLAMLWWLPSQRSVEKEERICATK